MPNVAEKVKQIEAAQAAPTEPESTRVEDASENSMPPSDDESSEARVHL